MTQTMAAIDAVWKVLAIGLLLGAGLPALFSLGVRQLAVASGAEAGARPWRYRRPRCAAAR